MTPRPIGIRLLVAFFAIATLICGASALSLAFPGSSLEILWRLKPSARVEFAGLGWGAVVFLLALGAAMAAAGVGLWRGRRWGWRLAVAIFAINLVGDGFRAAVAPGGGALLGVVIDALLIWYLLRPAIRRRLGQ